jgi:hypothetical protein
MTELANVKNIEGVDVFAQPVRRLNDGKLFSYVYIPDKNNGSYHSFRTLVSQGYNPYSLIDKSIVDLNPTRFQYVNT